jgi:hypothetical protein
MAGLQDSLPVPQAASLLKGSSSRWTDVPDPPNLVLIHYMMKALGGCGTGIAVGPSPSGRCLLWLQRLALQPHASTPQSQTQRPIWLSFGSNSQRKSLLRIPGGVCDGHQQLDDTRRAYGIGIGVCY